ncbi:MAG: PAS domain S-box protein [Cyanobacteria bacterium J06638_28]
MSSANPHSAPFSVPDAAIDDTSDDLFRAYIEAASDIVYTLDLKGTFTFVNSYGLELIGAQTYEEVVGRPYLEIIAPEYHAPTAAAFANLMQTGKLRDYEFAVLTKTGSRVFIEVNGRLLFKEGKLVGALGIGRDITERKRVESQLTMFSKALDSAHDSALISDLDGQLMYANLATQRMFEIPQSRLRGTSIEVFFQNEEQVRWLLNQATGEGWSGQIVCQRYNGQTFPALVSVSPVCEGKTSIPTAVSIILRDITQQEQIKAELAAKNLELERVNRLKSEFLANMSHELRTPMTSILGFSSLLEQQVYGELSDRQHLYVNQIHQSGEHLLALINEVLDLSKVEAGQMDLHIAPIAIETLCSHALTMVATQAETKGITIHPQVPADLPPLFADEMRVRQMLLNLLSNAVKFSHKGKAIGLDVERQENHLLITVWDEGIGIPKTEQSRLFQPFQQLDSSLSRKYEGTGLGLALTQRLARLHGGDITVDSDVGKGSRFTLHLPWDGRTASRQELEDSPLQRHLDNANIDMLLSTDMSASGQVLLVEDNPVNALLLEHMLNHWGYDTFHVPHGQAALQWLESNRPMLVLMDVQLPDIDGLEVTRKIRANPDWEDIPIVATTALARTRDRNRCLDAGMQDYLSKPINSAELVSILARYTWGED